MSRNTYRDTPIIIHADVVTNDSIFRDGYVIINNHKIASVTSRIPSRSLTQRSTFLDYRSKTLIPGMLDMHSHGVMSFDPSAGNTESVSNYSIYAAGCGVTGFLPTLWTDTISRTLKAIQTIRDAKYQAGSGARILGVNLEGPFLNRDKAGAQNRSYIIPPSLDILKKYIKIGNGLVKIVTLAPEIKGSAKLVKYLNKSGVIAAIGHTCADYGQTKAAIKSGVKYVTHLGNAMPPFHHREPGVIGAVLEDDTVFVEIIPDGVHLHPAFVKIITELKGVSNIAAVTDSLNGIEKDAGSFAFGGRRARVTDRGIRFNSGMLAGSNLKMNMAVKNLIEFTGKDIVDIIKLASLNPARIMKLDERKGSISVGKDADLAVIDDKYRVLMTMVEGKTVYER